MTGLKQHGRGNIIGSGIEVLSFPLPLNPYYENNNQACVKLSYL
jgi:hypothetical protein